MKNLDEMILNTLFKLNNQREENMLNNYYYSVGMGINNNNNSNIVNTPTQNLSPPSTTNIDIMEHLNNQNKTYSSNILNQFSNTGLYTNEALLQLIAYKNLIQVKYYLKIFRILQIFLYSKITKDHTP
jgi:hypothetical protein